jgi:carbamoyl-phosphate synthase large subunit
VSRPAVLLTGVGKRYDIVSAFAEHAIVVAADPSPLAPAQYAADVRVAPPRADDPAYIPFLEALCEEHGVIAVIPLTDLDLEVLARSALPAFVPDAEVCRRTFDKYLAHLLLQEKGLPSPPTWLPGEEPLGFPAVVKPRQGSGSRSIHPSADAAEADFFASYVKEPVMVQRFMDGPEFSVDVLCDLEGRCLNAIPRTMLESRGGESIKGAAIADPELIDLGRAIAEALPLRGPGTIQMFRDRELGLRVTDINARFGGAFACPMYAARAGQGYPELIVRMAQGVDVAPHVGDFLAGRTFTRFFWQLELDEELRPTGRDIVASGRPRTPRLGDARENR